MNEDEFAKKVKTLVADLNKATWGNSHIGLKVEYEILNYYDSTRGHYDVLTAHVRKEL